MTQHRQDSENAIDFTEAPSHMLQATKPAGPRRVATVPGPEQDPDVRSHRCESRSDVAPRGPGFSPESSETPPVEEAEPPVGEDDDVPTPDEGKDEPAYILVVDDEQSNLEVMRVALEGMRIRIVTARSGQEALRHLLHRNFAVILLDVQMPTMDGFETARLIRSRARNRHVPIIFVTAYSQNDADIRLGYRLGAVDYLFKPIVAEVLRAKVQVFVDLRNRTAEVQQQAEQLREMERQAAERRLQEARRAWEGDALRHQMAEQRRINEQLADSDRRKDEFLAVLAHELRNPLAPLVTGLELIRLQGGDNPVLGRARGAMERQVKHLVRLVDDLLDVSRISRGKIELQRRRVDLREPVREAVEMCRPALDERRHELRVHLPDERLICNADPDRLTQLVNNLLSNAIRYTDPSGTITVSLERDDGDGIIRVIDTGRGIPPELIDRVFEIFVQEQPGGRGGLGLGLTLVKQVAQIHGGTVHVSSEGRGKGSEFEVRLPLAGMEDTQPIEISEDDPDELPPLRIALVEDDPDVVTTVRDLLLAWGHAVEVACSGPEGAEMVIASRPDLALLDIGLPGLDGYGVAKRVRDALGEQRPRLVAVTGFGQDRDRQRASEAGFDAHLVKPANPDVLRRTLGAVMRGQILEER